VDEETRRLIETLQPTLKGYIKHTRSILAYLTNLDEQLDAHSQKEAQRHDAENTEVRAA
jgi:hypothetical protein